MADTRPVRVFVLGAGASACCGLPLTNRLLPEVLSSIDKPHIRDRLLKFVEYQYPHFKKPWKNYPNLEEFLSLIDVYLVFSKKVKRKHAFEDTEVEALRNELLRAISVFLCERAAATDITKTMLFRFAARLVPGDVVITFNWDFLLELALIQQKKDYSYVLDEKQVTLLKPHGSVDWFDGKEIKLRSDRTMDLIPSVGRISVYQYFRFPQVEKRIVPVIIPPVVNKQFEHKEFDHLFKDAWAALRHADEVYIVGFSLPPEDLHVRFIIRSALRANEAEPSSDLCLSLVNPDREVFLRFGRLVRSQVRYFEARFEDVSLNELLGKGPPVVRATLVKAKPKTGSG